MKVFLDTNVVIDLIISRNPFYKDIAEIVKIAEKKEIKLDEHIGLMKRLFLKQDYNALEEEAQVLRDYYERVQKEDQKLMAFKLIMTIRQEKWEDCAVLLKNIETAID